MGDPSPEEGGYIPPNDHEDAEKEDEEEEDGEDKGEEPAMSSKFAKKVVNELYERYNTLVRAVRLRQ